MLQLWEMAWHCSAQKKAHEGSCLMGQAAVHVDATPVLTSTPEQGRVVVLINPCVLSAWDFQLPCP